MTGGSSAIGKTVIRKCRENGHEVVEFTRLITKPNQRYFDLANDVFDIEVTDLDAMIHLAWDRKLDKQSGLHVSVASSNALIDKCKEFKIKLVYLSSTSASKSSTSNYGRSKYLAEQYVLDNGFSAVRSGLIWGFEQSGFYRSLYRIANTPIFGIRPIPDPLISYTEVEGLARYLVDCVNRDDNVSAGSYFINGELKLSKILNAMRIRRTWFRFGIHTRVLYLIARILQVCKIALPFDADSLRSIGSLNMESEYKTFRNKGTAIPTSSFIMWIEAMNFDCKVNSK